MMEQEQVLGRAGAPHAGQGMVPEQRGPVDLPPQSGAAYPGVPYRAEPPQAAAPVPGARLRVDARRNLESVLRAAREVFGEFGYGAPMEEVARRAGVGVGTVYRRFPSKEVLVQRIAAEEVAWLTAQARESLYGGGGAWEALAGYLARAVGTGAGRLLPPEAFRYAEELGRVPEQRVPEPAAVRFDLRGEDAQGGAGVEPSAADADPRLLLQLLAALVARAGAAGELRPGVTVSDVVLVLTASVPVHAARTVPATAGFSAGVPQAEGQPSAGPSDRLLAILLDGLRAR
ncbi:AcrR family transcriptional regulator [Kitasatospora sp. MAA19]|uniref:TetR/AcrR family transcriptional regulator n=1 Tax=unclassified Kitasatospora TaxID=2633591 RepID=UPI002475D311|nr:helix-turn-helix domain-containing protein [Kitasatospora sp. MAA19]MDH6711177.1 AcrR family transcriptional regulator [Kitasatospora sp. MAA19]